MKTFYWLGGIFVIAVGLIFIFSGSSSTISPALELDKVNPRDHVEGNASSTVTVIEYGDFQCPACRSYYPVVKEMVSQFGPKVAFVFRHFPLIGIHMNAEFAARAAEAAGLHGKFWEMHNLLYEKQDEWATQADFMPLFESYAELVGISKEQFDADFNSKEVKDFVKAERSYGNEIGITGTPTFYINGKKIENPASPEAFRLLIQQALDNKPVDVKPLNYKDLIQINSPASGAAISSPVKVEGLARGNWYFEASFPAYVLDEDGTTLGSAPIQAKGDWMTEQYSSFSGEITFKQPKGKTGKIVFKKDNPSDKRELDDEVSIPVVFK